jgi:hypothetical protein
MSASLRNRAECETALRQTLLLSGPPNSVQAHILAGIVDACEEPDDTPQLSPRDRHQLRVGRWVIRDDDLELFQIVKTAMLAFSAAQFTFTSLSAGGATALAFSAAQLVRNVFRKGISLDPKQLQLLLVLKASSKPMAAHEIAAALGTDPNWSGRDVEQELARLRKMQARGGSVSLVEENSDQQWLANGV